MTSISIAPNSGKVIHENLTNLSTADIMSIVISNKCPLRFVKFNSIIWEHWNDIFSSAKYIWKVVRKYPYAVKIWLPHQECLLCQPDKKSQGLYNPTLLTRSGKRSTKLSKQKKPVSLKDAIQICEDYLDNNRFDINFPALLRIEPQYSLDDEGNKHCLFTFDTPNGILGTNGKISEGDINVLKNLGINDDDIQFIKSNYKPTDVIELKHILTADIEPEQEDINEITRRKLYADPNLLSHAEVIEILNANIKITKLKPQRARKTKAISPNH